MGTRSASGGRKPRGGHGLSPALGQVDGLRADLDGIVVALADLFQDVAHLVHPAALMGGARVHGLDGRRQAGTSVGDDQQQFVALQTATIEVVEQRFPVGLAFAFGAQKAEQLAGAILAHAVSHQHLHALSAAGRRTFRLTPSRNR